MTRSFRLALVPLALAASAALAGCQHQLAPPAGPEASSPMLGTNDRIAVLAPTLRPVLEFQAAQITRGDRPMQVQIETRNVYDRKYLVDYRYLYFDANGMQLEPVMGWTMASFEPYQSVPLRGSSLSMDAVDYRLEVKWSE